MGRSRKAGGRKKVSAKRWRSEHRGGAIYVRIPEGISFFKEKAETFRLDFMSYVVGKGNPRADKAEQYFERTFFIHKDIGPNKERHLCLAKTFREPCPICEFRAKQMADPDSDEKFLKDLAPKERQLWLLRDLGEDPMQVLLWDISYHLFGRQLRDKLLNADEDDGYDYFADPQEGHTVRVAFSQKSGEGSGSWFEAVDIEFRARKTQYDSEDVEDMPCLDDLLVPTSYEKLKQLFLQTEESEEDKDDDDKDDEKEEKSEKAKERSKKPSGTKLKVGETVFFKGGPCEILKIGGDDGEKLMVEDMDKKVHRITTDDIDPEPPKKEEKKSESKKEEELDKDDDSWFDDDKETDAEEAEKKEERKKSKPKEKEEPDKDDWWGDD